MKFNKYKAVFLDRDGVINIDKGYVYKIENFEFVDGVFEALEYLQKLKYKLFIITNQSGIGRGYYSMDDFQKLTYFMLNKFKKSDIKIEDVQFCPHSPDDNCKCRKPQTKMVENILKKYDIELEKSWLIGDKESDILCAINAGIKNTILVNKTCNNVITKANFQINKFDYSSIIKIIT